MPKWEVIFARALSLALALVWLSTMAPACSKNRENIQRDAKTSHTLALAFLTENRPSLALRELAKAESLTPDDPEIQNTLGEAYWRKLEYGKAEESFKKATALKPDYGDAWNNLGALYLFLKRYPEAVAALEHAVQDIYYETPERALTNLGWAQFKLGQLAEAEGQYKQALELAPGFPLAQKHLGALFQERGQHAEALQQLDAAERLLPEDAEIQLLRGRSLLSLGDRAAARDAFERAWRLAPGSEIGKSAKTYVDLLE
jgi:type IV pilus biogenesis/stability protein PilW